MIITKANEDAVRPEIEKAGLTFSVNENSLWNSLSTITHANVDNTGVIFHSYLVQNR